MIYAELAARARRAAAWCFALLGLAIPLSTAFDGTVVALIVLAWVAALPHDFRDWRATLAITPVAVAIVLFVLIAVGTLYGDATAKEAWKMALKYADLFLISVLLWAAAGPRTADRALHMFLLAIVLNLIVSYAVAMGIVERVPGLYTQQAYPVGFKLSVTHGIFVSFGAFVFLLLAREARTHAARALSLGLAALCAGNVLAIVIGRTGYVVLALLLTYLALTSIRTWKVRGLAVSFVALLFVGAYAASGNFQVRVDNALADLAQWTPGAADTTSVGQRIEYARVSAGIVAEYPLTGVGTGGFTAAYKEAADSALVTTNPHNDYLMIGVQLGLPGIALLIALYVLLWRDAGRLPSRFDRDLLRGIVLTMASAGLFNSVVLDHAEGLLLAWTVALVYARSGAGRHA